MESAAEIAGELGDEAVLATVFFHLAQARVVQGRQAEACAASERALALFAAQGDERAAALARSQLAGIRTSMGDDLRSLGDVHCEAEALWLTGTALTDLECHEEAAPLLELALARVREVPDRDDEFRICIDLARLQRETGQPREALALALHAGEIASALGCRDGAGRALIEVSRAHLALGTRTEALTAAEEAVDQLTRTGSGDLWRGLWALGLAQETWSLRLAATTLERCVSLLAAMRSPLPLADRRTFEEVRRSPVADLHRLLLAAGESGRAGDLRLRWPVALGDRTVTEP